MTLYTMLKNYIEAEPIFKKDKQYIFSCVILPICLALKIKNISQYNLFVNNKGEEVIKTFLNDMVDKTHYEGWLKDVIENDKDDYKEKIIEVYHGIFTDETGFYHLPFFEANSLLGTDLLIENED